MERSVQLEVVYSLYDNFSSQNYLETLWSPQTLPSKKCWDDLES
jgi:hypothetical protein